MKNSALVLLAVLLCAVSCRNISEEERLFTDDFWKDAVSYSGFTDPWEEYTDNTVARVVATEKQLCFRFDVQDTSFVVYDEISKEMDVADEDRVEVFLSPYPEIGAKYFSTEIDPLGRCLDYSCVIDKQMDYGWSFSTQKIHSRKYEDGYTVIVCFDRDEINALIGEGPQYVGLFRADYHHGLPVNWCTVAIPDSPVPDFHIPSAFFPLQF